MARIKLLPFSRTKEIEKQIDEFLDKVSEAGLAFEMGVGCYLSQGVSEACQEKWNQVSELEHQGDDLRRTIETALYIDLLIPDFRGDVLSLLEDLDELIDMMKSTLRSILIEQHDVPSESKDDIKELVSASVKSVECTVNATRAFFSDLTSVRDHIHKIGFYEREADKIAIRLKKMFFGTDGPLDRKMHLRDLVTSIEEIADEAENVGDRLTIYCIKRAP